MLKNRHLKYINIYSIYTLLMFGESLRALITFSVIALSSVESVLFYIVYMKLYD